MILRSLLLLIPFSAWAWLIINQHLSVRELTAAFLGMMWVFLATLILNMMFLHSGFLTISIHDTLFYGVPLDWVLSQSIIYGALIPLLRRRGWSTVQRLALLCTLTLVIYHFTGIDTTNPATAAIFYPAIIFAIIPGMLLSDWTATDTHIAKRSILQSIAWAVMLFWLFPSIVFVLTNDSWENFTQQEIINIITMVIPLLLPAYLLLSALYQFAIHGGGTAFPYDPPKRLVTGGIYQYISNPMQLGICLSMGWWGVVIQSYWILASAFIAVVLFIVFKDICNGSCAIGANNKEWEEYQKTVPKWFPRKVFQKKIKDS